MGRRRRRQKKTTAEAGGSGREVSNRTGQQASPANYDNQASQGAIARTRFMIGSMVTFLGGLVTCTLSFCAWWIVVAQLFREAKTQGDNVIRCLKQGAEICQLRPYNCLCDLIPFIRNMIENISAIIDNDRFLIVLYTIVGVYIFYKSVQRPRP